MARKLALRCSPKCSGSLGVFGVTVRTSVKPKFPCFLLFAWRIQEFNGRGRRVLPELLACVYHGRLRAHSGHIFSESTGGIMPPMRVRTWPARVRNVVRHLRTSLKGSCVQSIVTAICICASVAGLETVDPLYRCISRGHS